MRKFISWGIFMLVLAAGVILVQPLSVVIVDGHSMEPTYHHDDLVLAYERESYAVGDVIVYDANVAGQFNVVHRVIEPTEGGFITQGDNVPEPDFWIAEHERIHGSVFLHIPRGGIAAQWLRQPFVILSLFLGWAAFEFMRAREKEQSDRKNEYREGGYPLSSSTHYILGSRHPRYSGRNAVLLGEMVSSRQYPPVAPPTGHDHNMLGQEEQRR